MKFLGKIVAADATDRTITIKCDESISGIQIGGTVIINDDFSVPLEKDNTLYEFAGMENQKDGK